jgi:hypothetical protein
LLGGKAFARGISNNDISGQPDKLFAHVLSFLLFWFEL